MKGLEATTIPKSKLNCELRYDAEFFHKQYLIEDSALSRVKSKPIGDFAVVTDGQHGYHVIDDKSPIAMLTAKNARGWLSDREGADRIAKETHEANLRSSLESEDIILSTRGTVGLCAIVLSETLPANLDQDVARISWKNRKEFLPEFVVAYLNSTFGQDHIQRYATGMVQQGLSLQRVREIPMPMLSLVFQDQVRKVVRSAIETRTKHKTEMYLAEELLLETLGLADWNPPDPMAYTTRASAAFAAGRIDAEHFRPKFAALVEKMMLHGKVVRLGDYLRFCERGRQPNYADEGLPVVNSRHVRGGVVELDSQNRFANEDASQLRLDQEERATIKQGDVLMNGTGVGTMGRCAAYLYEDKALPDNHITILRPTVDADLDPVFLATQLNSVVGQMQVEQYFKGSSGQIELYPTEIREFRIWLAPQLIQRNVRKHIEFGHRAYELAQATLDRAKRGVEIAIEDSEAAALKYLKES